MALWFVVLCLYCGLLCCGVAIHSLCGWSPTAQSLTSQARHVIKCVVVDRHPVWGCQSDLNRAFCVCVWSFRCLLVVSTPHVRPSATPHLAYTQPYACCLADCRGEKHSNTDRLDTSSRQKNGRARPQHESSASHHTRHRSSLFTLCC